MKNLLSIAATLGVVISGQAVLAIPPKPQIITTQSLQSSNQMTQMLSAWGFTPTACQGNVANISNKTTGEIACVQPSSELGAGKFVYDPGSNQIKPNVIRENNQQSNFPQNQGSFGHVNPVPQTQDPRISQMVFTFNNLYDYGTCLDAILLAYEGREFDLQNMKKNKCANDVISLFGTRLSKDITLQLLDLANFRATKLLQKTLYPSFGLRRRAAMYLGYVYKIDKNDSEILNYAASAR